MDFLNNLDMAQIAQWIGIALAIVTALNVALAAIAPLTKTKKDDGIVAFIAKWLPKVRALLSKLGPSLPANKTKKD